MPEWLTVLSTLAGTVIGGSISFLAQWMSTRSARRNQQVHLTEQRLTWATERELAQLQAFNAELRNAIDAVVEFRCFEARKALYPETSKDGNGQELRGNFEDYLYKMRVMSLFCDITIEEKFAAAENQRSQWMVAPNRLAGVECLMELERCLFDLQAQVAGRYRTLVNKRRDGSDAILKNS